MKILLPEGATSFRYKDPFFEEAIAFSKMKILLPEGATSL